MQLASTEKRGFVRPTTLLGVRKICFWKAVEDFLQSYPSLTQALHALPRVVQHLSIAQRADPATALCTQLMFKALEGDGAKDVKDAKDATHDATDLLRCLCGSYVEAMWKLSLEPLSGDMPLVEVASLVLREHELDRLCTERQKSRKCEEIWSVRMNK